MNPHQTTFLLLDLAIIIVLARSFGALARRLGQPPIIGEVAAGILVGPTLLGAQFSAALFPLDTRPYLSALANVGVAMFMFLVGLELNRDLLRGHGPLAVTVSASSIVVPFGLGVCLAMYLIHQHPAEHRLGFLLFVGAAMSVTAFPVLARILSDRNLQRTRLGSLALTCAAIDDILAWTLLAAVIAISGSGGDTPMLLLLAIPYAAIMIGVVRPLLRRHFATRDRLTPGALGMIFVGVLVSGAITEWIGLHLLFGAFLFGTMMPRAGLERLRTEIVGSIERFNGALLLPAFFIVAGLKVNLSGMDATGLLELTLIMLVAVTGKFGGAFAAARLHRLPGRQSALLATLMNTRGLTELIILSVGLQLGLLDGPLYSIMVVMALVTTAMAGPLLRLFGLKPDNPEAVDWDPADAKVRSADLAVAARPNSAS